MGKDGLGAPGWKSNKGWIISILLAIALVVGIALCASGCTFIRKGLDELDSAAEKIAKFQRGVDRVLYEAVGFYEVVKPVVVAKCEAGEYKVSACDRLHLIDLQLIEIYTEAKDGSADLASILEGIGLAVEAFELQLAALEEE